MMSVDEALELLRKFIDAKEKLDRFRAPDLDVYHIQCTQEIFDAIEVAIAALEEKVGG